MNTVTTKFQVTAAAAAVAACAAFAPVAAHAAPALSLPAAPVNQIVNDFKAEPGIFYYGTVVSLQVVGSAIKLQSAAYDRQTSRLSAYAAANPGTFFGNLAAGAVQRKLARQARLNGIAVDYCINGGSVALGPYGAVTTGTC
jgi:hypothetical protein